MEWIPCEERLPDGNREVLISLEWGIDIGTYERGEWRSEWINHYDDDNVLAWMPLPQPYTADRKTEPNCSEKPNNCEHITEDGVTCAKYPACDDCPDNPLNKVKGSERLVKGSEQTDCQTCKWWSGYGYCVHRECKGYEPQTERSSE